MVYRKEVINRDVALVENLLDRQLHLLQMQFAALRPLSDDLTREEILREAERAINRARTLCKQLHETCSLAMNTMDEMRQALRITESQIRELRKNHPTSKMIGIEE